VAVSRSQSDLAPSPRGFPRPCFRKRPECLLGALSADDLLAHDTLEPRHDDQDSTRRRRLDSIMKDDENAEHIVRSSILKLLRKDEPGSTDSSPQRAVETSVESALDNIWALRSKARGSPIRFEA
jgi:hypothetical protein